MGDAGPGIIMFVAGILLGVFIGWNAGIGNKAKDCDTVGVFRTGSSAYTCTTRVIGEGK